MSQPLPGIDDSQRTAARVVGFAYLFALIPANFAEFYVSGHLIANTAADTARNIMAHERLFRLGTASNLLVFVTDVVLLTSLYVVLKPVNRSLALLATLFRVIETAMISVVALNDLQVLRVLSGAKYLRVFEADRLQALARLSIGGHSDAYFIGLLFFGIGSAVFAYVWLESGYIPRWLAILGLLGSVLVTAGSFAYVVFPEVLTGIALVYFAPIFVFELVMGFLLLFKGLRPSLVPATQGIG
jgi:hypothetical protein